jgi:hypothetical protein
MRDGKHVRHNLLNGPAGAWRARKRIGGPDESIEPLPR